MEVQLICALNFEEFVTHANPDTVSPHMVNWFDTNIYFPSDYPVMFAYLVEDGKIIAVWSYNEDHKESVATYVENKHRRRGLASLLWKSKPSVKKGTSCSRAGKGFLNYMKRTQGVEFEAI